MATDTRTLLDQMERELHKPRPTEVPAGPLFHYTSGAGLLGIVRERQIWATHYAHAKDVAELIEAERVVDEVARGMLRETPQDTPAEWLLENFLGLHRAKGPERTRIGDIYVTSLSERGDKLSQWRGYAGEGLGYSIGFSDLQLRKTDSSDAGFAVTLVKCEYDRERFEESVVQVLTEVVTGFEAHVRAHCVGPEMFNAFMTRGVSIALRRVLLLVPGFKDAAFAEEEEWRLVAIPTQGREAEVVRFRSSRRGIVPYIGIELGEDQKLKLAKVYVGPMHEPAIGRKAIVSFLSSLGYDDESLVESSGISYRG